MNPKVVMVLWSYRKELLGVLLGCLALLCVIGAAVAGVFLAGVPLVPDELLPVYQREAQDLAAPDGTKVGGLDWQQLVAIDAVRYEQDFSRVTESGIHELAQRFIKKVKHEKEVCETITDPLTGAQHRECRTDVTYTYELHPPATVMAGLAFSPDQLVQAQAMLMVDAAPGLPGPPSTVIGDCGDFIPNPASSYLWPAHGVITSCFGYRIDPVVGGEGFHTGIDIAAAWGTPIRAAQAGTVTTAEYTGNYGNLIVIQGAGIHTWYGHLSAYAVSSGQQIRKGAIIGYMGSTGKSTGPHLHFETRPGGRAPVDPRSYFQ